MSNASSGSANAAFAIGTICTGGILLPFWIMFMISDAKNTKRRNAAAWAANQQQAYQIALLAQIAAQGQVRTPAQVSCTNPSTSWPQ